MGLKNIEFARAEDLTPELRRENNLPDKGIIIIETLNDNLHTEFKPMPEGGIREYLLSFGDFLEDDSIDK